jgi:hypothetical protein
MTSRLTTPLGAAAGLLLVVATHGSAQLNMLPQPVQAPPYALTNVRIVVAPGRVIERGTVVTENGRITAAGAQVTVPTGAVRMDLAGHTVFAGIVDAATSVGLPATNRPPATATPPGTPAPAGGRGAGPAPAGGRGGTPAPVVMPEIDATAEAAEMFNPTPAELEAFRASGITTVGLVFQGGLFPGRVGAALTGGQNEGRLALRTTIGQVVAFGTLRGGYPGTGIGSVAFVRQTILDGQHEALLERAFRAGNPAARPTYNPLPRGIMSAAAGDIPFWFAAGPDRPIGRVIEIAKEMSLKTPVVVGAQDGWRHAAALKQLGATAVVSLSGGGGRGGRGGGGAAGAAAPPGASAATAVDPRANASTLAKAGVPIAFASMGEAAGFRDRIRTAIEGGLSADDALRAATVTPAALLGISTSVGTVEAGKLANLVVVSGNDLFATGTPVKHVFVEGRLYTIGN